MRSTRIVPKPWGQEIIWAQTEDYVGKVLEIKYGHKLSRQYHEIKEETIYVVYGTLVRNRRRRRPRINRFIERRRISHNTRIDS